jgi:hypothetical protein
VSVGSEIAALRDKVTATARRSQWSYGDEAAKDQLFEVIAGKTRMRRGGTDDEAETIRDENGNRILRLNGYKDNMPLDERLLLGVNIQHEAYRDGVKTADWTGNSTNWILFWRITRSSTTSGLRR